MKKSFKRIVAAAVAVATMAVSAMSVSAYNDSDSMILRNVTGAPGNVLSGTLTINSKTSNSYYTSYDFAMQTGATVTVTATNTFIDPNTNSAPKVVLNKRNKAQSINAVARYSYITFSGVLSNNASESGIWAVS